MMQTLRRIPFYCALALLVYMPFHIFLSQSLSLATGGLDIWKAGKDLLTILLVFITVSLVLTNSKLRQNKPFMIMFGLAVAYGVLHELVYMIQKETTLEVALLASTYNNRLFWYFLIGAGGVLLTDRRLTENKIIKLVLVLSTMVCVFGIVQWFVPTLMTHFGYQIERGVRPIFYINDDSTLPRVMSTIRDPNSLGAYLLVPIMLLVSLLPKRPKDRMLLSGLLGLHLLALSLSFSRAALVGLVIMLGFYAIVSHKEKAMAATKKYWPLFLVLLIFAGGLAYAVKDTKVYRSVVLRADDNNPAQDPDSDELHLFYIQEGVEGIAERPVGYGPGTAGIVSIQNESGGLLTENYYVQVAHEVGIIGLAIFITGWAYVTRLLWRTNSLLSHSLVFVATGYAIMALVMHLWSNEAIAALWWLLAGITVGANKVKTKGSES